MFIVRLLLCVILGEKSAFCRDFGNGVTIGVTDWGYIFLGMGLQNVEMGGWIERG